MHPGPGPRARHKQTVSLLLDRTPLFCTPLPRLSPPSCPAARCRPMRPPPGVFGCHAALVLRRLRRLCERAYGIRPTFVVTTATVANPREHACALLGVEEVEGEQLFFCFVFYRKDSYTG